MKRIMLTSALIFMLGGVASAISWIDGETPTGVWRITTSPPHVAEEIYFSGPLSQAFTNYALAEVEAGGSPTISIDNSNKTIELWFEPPPPDDIPTLYHPICGLEGNLGSLEAGKWIFFGNNPVASFSISFDVLMSDFLCGDVSGNGDVSAYDAALVAQYAVGMIDWFTEEQIWAADVNCDGSVTSEDAQLIAEYAIGLIDELQCCSCSCPYVIALPATDINSTSATLWGKIEDDGGCPCKYRFRYRLDEVGAKNVYTDWTGSVATGESFSQTISGLKPDSKYYFSVQVKNDDCQSSWALSKNFTTTDGTLPDLYDDGEAHSGFSPRTITRDDPFEIYCDIRNGGGEDTESFEVDFYVSVDASISSSDYHIGSVEIPGIDRGASCDCEWSGDFPTNIPSGQYYVGWIIDVYDEIHESNESNNTAYKEGYKLTVDDVDSGLTVTSPNGGESWQRGTSHDITWNSIGNIGSYVNIELHKGGVLNRTIIGSTSNDGSYSWPIPENQTIGSDYKIKITSISNSSYYYDYSNDNFTITKQKPLTVIAPNGGESWQRGASYDIIWTWGGNVDRHVKIQLLKGDDFDYTIEGPILAIKGSYSWSIPPDQAIGSDYNIKITLISDSDPEIFDESDGYFSIHDDDGNDILYPAKLVASDGEPGDWFGRAVSISGKHAVVGSFYDDDKCGSAYIFKCTPTGWIEQQPKLTHSYPAINDYFGCSVSIDGDYAIIGIDGDEYDQIRSGTTYIFKRTDTSWTKDIGLVSSDRELGDRFGCAVSISGDYSIIGSYWDDDHGDSSGSAYVFKRGVTGWVEDAKLIASDGAAGDWFGYTVSINGDYAIVGASLHDRGGLLNCGAAYIFKNENAGWTEKSRLLAVDREAEDEFGGSVSISGNYAVVGAICDDTAGEDAGAAYIFERIGENWIQRAKLIASDLDASEDHFGNSVSIDGDYVIVGSSLDDDLGEDSGAAYIFKREGKSWQLQTKLTAPNGEERDYFGRSVSISGDYVVVGTPYDDDSGDNAGCAYIFKRNGTKWLP
jgi:hypothetical protein